MIALDLTDRRALVLGASGGLGGAVARSLSQAGAHVTGASRSQPASTGASAEMEWRALDLADADSVAGTAAWLKANPVDILVNVSGGPPPGPVVQPDEETWAAQFQAMVLSLVQLTNAALPAMQAAGWGRIVTVTSSGTSQPIPGLGLSNTLRSSLVGWSKTLAGEVAADGVTVNLLQPGRIDTARVGQLDKAAAARKNATAEDVRRESISTIPAGRYGRPEEFGNAAAFLCSDLASYVTGSTIRVDGGYIRGV